MKIKELRKSLIEGVYEISPYKFEDNRGSFTKIFHSNFFEKYGLNSEWLEQYYSISKKNVIRGMHFQLPPYEHDKLVSCLEGEILDVVVDLRKNSKSFGKVESFELTGEEGKSIYIPKGCAHGFYTRSETALIFYNVSTVYVKENDSGIKWDSIDFEWPDCNPIISERDAMFPKLKEFNSPFS